MKMMSDDSDNENKDIVYIKFVSVEGEHQTDIVKDFLNTCRNS